MYDIIIIGAGSAGISAYKEAIKHTKNILIINHGPWDTTCARVGCMPSKVLIAAANRMHDIHTANKVGLDVSADIDTSHVMSHVRELRDRFTRATLKDVESWDESHKVSGKAQFINKDTITVNDKSYQAKSFIIAVGSTPNIDKKMKSAIGDRLITSDQIFEIQDLPKSIAVIGSGVIAIELAQALHRLGVQTTVFARSQRVGVLSSPNLQTLAQNIMSNELNIKFETLPISTEIIDDLVKIKYKDNEGDQELFVEYVLNATGRKSHLDSLALSKIDDNFSDIDQLPINKTTKQLANLPIFITGDAYTYTPVQHEASHEGKASVLNCLNYPKIDSVKTLVPLGIMFSAPEMANVGYNYKYLKDSNIEFVIGFASYEKQGRSIVNGKNKGAIEVYVDKKSGKLIGAELLATGAEHLSHLLAWSIAQKLTIDDILENPFYHPTIEEGLRTALKHARRQLSN